MEKEEELETKHDSDEYWFPYTAEEWKEMKSLGAVVNFVSFSTEDLQVDLELTNDECIVQGFFVSLETWNALIDILKEYDFLEDDSLKF